MSLSSSMFILHSNWILTSNAVAEKVTEDVDAQQLINDLNKAFDSIEAELKRPPSPLTKGPDNNDDVSLEDDSNVILSCKKHLISLLSAYFTVYVNCTTLHTQCHQCRDCDRGCWSTVDW